MLVFCFERTCDTLSISVSLVRWPQTFTTCWTAMDTSWTVAVSSRWRGKARWPLTSSPAALRLGSVCVWVGAPQQRLQRHPRVSTHLSSEALCKREQMTADAHKQCLSACCRVATATQVEFVQVQRLFPPPHAAGKITKPSCLRMEVAMI